MSKKLLLGNVVGIFRNKVRGVERSILFVEKVKTFVIGRWINIYNLHNTEGKG